MMSLTEIVSFVIGAGAIGYASSWVFYIFRRIAWTIT